MVEIAVAIGTLGLIVVTAGVTIRQRAHQDLCYVFGGFCLAVYSIYLRNPIFAILQVMFVAVAGYDLLRGQHT